MKYQNWWSHEDLTIICNHKDDEPFTRINISSLENDITYVTCPDCGQKYAIKLEIVPVYVLTEPPKDDTE